MWDEIINGMERSKSEEPGFENSSQSHIRPRIAGVGCLISVVVQVARMAETKSPPSRGLVGTVR